MKPVQLHLYPKKVGLKLGLDFLGHLGNGGFSQSCFHRVLGVVEHLAQDRLNVSTTGAHLIRLIVVQVKQITALGDSIDIEQRNLGRSNDQTGAAICAQLCGHQARLAQHAQNAPDDDRVGIDTPGHMR